MISEILDSRLTVYSLAGLILLQMIRNVYKKMTLPKTCSEDMIAVGDDVSTPVRVFVFAGCGTVVSSSPFSVKVTAFLRLAGIPHTVHEADIGKAPNGKVPYIKHNENTIGDSQLIIRYLENTFDIKKMSPAAAAIFKSSPFVSYSDMEPGNQAITEMVRLTCEGQLYWSQISARWLGGIGITRDESQWRVTAKAYFDKIPAFIRPFLLPIIRKSVFDDAWAFGLARHSANDQLFLVKRALAALSAILGSKKFILGEYPSEADCILFGSMQGLCDDSLWSSPITNYIRDELPNLWKFNERFHQIYYADMKPGDTIPQSRVEGLKAIKKTDKKNV